MWLVYHVITRYTAFSEFGMSLQAATPQRPTCRNREHACLTHSGLDNPPPGTYLDELIPITLAF